MSGSAQKKRFVDPNENHHYDSTSSALDAHDYANAGEIRMNMLRARQNVAAHQQIPPVADIHRIQAATNTQVQHDAANVAAVAQASHAVAAMEAAVPAVGSVSGAVPVGPLANPNAASRARFACIGAVSGMLGIVVGAGILAGVFKLKGYLDTADQMAAGQTPTSQPTADELTIWSTLPGATALELLKTDATRTGAAWSVGTWNYVTTFLVQLLNKTDAANTASYATLFVSDTQLQADYADWKTNGAFDPIYIFDQSAAYPDPKTDPNHDAHALRVRVDYMSRITAMAIAMDGP